MEYSVTDYFEADANLKKAIHEINLHSHAMRKQPLNEAKKRMKIAAEKIDELTEIFTWETTNTDHIRRAFITLACSIESQLVAIRLTGLFPDLYNGTNNPSQLMEDITRGFLESLKSRGRFQPGIVIKTGILAWKDESLMSYVKDMQRHLERSTFDNLLEAVTYFEKSGLLLQLMIQPSSIKKPANNYII
ncbi:hypothetical protein [Pedobacter metabolipauper]|uniref:Uncharacterized protein n=1 Tax=Pedobacter metabolipauper TaxID=425513 RepID=A0A4V3D0X9_9SPHI|nr:hypothetical protein [Pedobacter metabolipauper]TDQ08244.1 hypothetical protein ATK78_2752 [Pedobacter metabolipauper]